MNALELPGCRPRPLLSYLKALGLFRLVGEQADPEARVLWTPRGLEVRTRLDRDELERFLLENYVPTPIVAPWNRGSGFFLAKGKTPEKLLDAVREVNDPRLRPLQDSIEVGLQLHEVAERRGWDVNRDKDRWVAFCRNRLPEQAVDWIDAATVLADEGIVYPVLLGSGGNLGRLDLTHNWLQHVVTVLGIPIEGGDAERGRSLGLLRDAFDGTSNEPAVEAAVGQFDPGRAGGANLERAADKGTGARWVNPWDFVLALEGAPLLAAGVARRSGSQGGRSVAAMPFTVRSSGVGHSDAASDESTSGELWLPLWGRSATLGEVRRLFSEARAQWDGRQAGTGLDFVQAVATLGAERGVEAFERYDIVERLGRSSLAVPAGRIRVVARPEAGLLAPIDRWIDRVVRVSDPPAGVEQSARKVRAAQFAVAANGGTARLWRLLEAVAELQRRVSRSGSVREPVLPLPGLDPGSWLPLLASAGEEAELDIAVGLASLRDLLVKPRDRSEESRPHTLAGYLLPIVGPDPRRRWARGSPPVGGFRSRPLAAVLADVLAERSAEDRTSSAQDARIELLGVEPWFKFGREVEAVTVEAFAGGHLDMRRIENMLDALLLFGWEWDEQRPPDSRGGHLTASPVPAWRLLAPFFAPMAVGRRTERGRWTPILRLRPQPDWAPQLTANHVPAVAHAALQRLRVAGLSPLVQDVDALAAGSEGTAIACALLVHMSAFQTRRLLDRMTGNLPEIVGETGREIA